jgi:hypothetical protein
MHMAQDDAVAAVFDAKYAYNFWCPVTAIRAAHTDGNDATSPDPEWLPLRPTPAHLEYPCAHCLVSAAMCGVLASVAGNEFTFTLESPTLAGKPRTFQKFSDYVELSGLGRLYAGFHYRNSSTVGADMGRKIGSFVVRNSLSRGPELAGNLRPGEFRLTTRNVGGLQQRIEVSPDLRKWSPLADYINSDFSIQILDTDAGNSTHKFYRAVSPQP